jgi:Carboxypeptidase regulatory-like domain/TonB-dependent Receptor Plug Domain
MNPSKVVAQGLCLGVLLACMIASFNAQETTGTITGLIKDLTGAVIPDVEVRIRNAATGLERRVTTGSEGDYTATQLPIGRYEVVVERAGFKKFTAKGIALSVNDRLRLDVVLELGEVTEVVEVQAVVSAVQSETAEVGTVITGRQVVDMPLNGRSLYQLVALQPGVSASSALVSGRVGVGLDNLASVNVNGARASQNNWLIDGADNVDTGSNQGTINFIGIDNVSEFKILRGNYSAEFGRNTGGQINVVTKSGTNEFHGGLFEFWRNNLFDARNFFSVLDRNGDGKADPALLRYHNFGWNLGGPIKKDKLFFYYGQELRRVRTVRGAGVVNTRVPTALQRQGDFSEFSDVIVRDPLTGQQFSYQGRLNVIPPDRLDPNALALNAVFPLPNASAAVLGGRRNFSSAAPGGRNYREELVRVDYEVSNAHRVFGRWVRDTIPSTEPFGEVFGTNNASFPGVAETKTNIPARNVVGEWTWIPSGTVINNVAFNYSRGGIFSEITGSAGRNIQGLNVPELFAQNPGNLLPGIFFGGAGEYGTFDFFGPYDNSYGSKRIKETLSIVKGKHALKMGYLFSHEFKNENAASGVNGAFTFPGTNSATFTSSGDAYADFLLGRASQYTEKDIDITSNLRYDMHEAFVQDDWKALSNLAFNLGVRWSYILPPTDTQDLLTNFDAARFDPARAYQIAADGSRVPGTGNPMNGLYQAGKDSPYGRRIVASHADTFGPRFGFSWDPFRSGKTAIRGGYGIYFDRTLVGIALQNAFVNPPFVTQSTFLAAGAAGSPTLSNPAGGAQRNQEAIVPTLISMSPDFSVPTVQQWSFGVQRDLPWKLAVDASYAGHHGTHLLRAVRINQTPAGTTSTPTNAFATFRGYGMITERQTSAGSRYDSFQLGVSKRMSKGVQFGLAYTLSKVITDSPDDRTTIAQNLKNLRADRAIASFDKTHIFVTNYIWELPFFRDADKLVYNLLGGWQIGGIYRAETGTPLTVTIAPNRANSFFGGGQRPDLIGNPEGSHTIEQWFNPAAFALPALNSFGNAGRSLMRGPGLNLCDLSIYKNFRISEAVRVQFRGEMFNAFNHTNFSGVGTTFAATTYGRVTSALEPRQVQFGVKLNF